MKCKVASITSPSPKGLAPSHSWQVASKGDQVGPFAPAVTTPEGFAVGIAADEEDRAAADAPMGQFREAPIDELGGDAQSAKARMHAEVIKIAAPAVATAENGAGQRRANASDEAQAGIAIENAGEFALGLVGADTFAGIPEVDDRGIVGEYHRRKLK